MKTKNAMQLKALINNKAKAARVSPQLMLQNYMLERFDRPYIEVALVRLRHREGRYAHRVAYRRR